MRNPRRLYLLVVALCFFSARSIGQIDTSGVEKLFEMSLSDLMDQDVITASKFIQRSASSGSSISVITADEINNFNYSTLGEVLNSQRGMYLSNDRNYLYVGSRGFSRPTDYNNRIVTMIDGHIMNEVVYGSSFMGNDLGLNLKNVQKIEIVRGPGASLYGSGAMLNTINVIMKKGSETDGLLLSAGTGSFGKKEFSTVYGKKIKNIDISVSGIGGTSKGEDFYFPELDSVETNYGVSSGMDWEKYAGVHANITWNNLKLSGSYSSRHKGIPTGAYYTDITGDVSSLDNRYFIETNYKKELRNNSLFLFRIYYDGYFYKGSYPAGGIDSFDSSVGKWAGSEMQYYINTGKRNSIISGIEYKYTFMADFKEWDNSTIFFYKNRPSSFFSVYSHDQFTIAKNFTFTAGLRFDHYSVFGQSVSPRTALVYEYSKASSVKLLYSEAFRIPNIYESFYESANTQKRNPDIKPEKIRTFELTWGHEINEKLYGSLSLYRFSMINLIDQILDESDGLVEFININSVNGTGFEVELRYQASKTNNGYINLSFQKAEDPATRKFLSNAPEILIKSGYVLPVSRYFTITPELFYESGRYTLIENRTGNVCLLNLSVRTMKFLKYFDLSLKARNLFNFKYKYPGGYEHRQDAILQESRTLNLQLNAQF
jgi:outer membrane cobalamin receptor